VVAYLEPSDKRQMDNLLARIANAFYYLSFQADKNEDHAAGG
jgi:hypothetical protein